MKRNTAVIRAGSSLPPRLLGLWMWLILAATPRLGAEMNLALRTPAGRVPYLWPRADQWDY